MEFQSHGQTALRQPIDLLCLAAVPKPDASLQQKYDSWHACSIAFFLVTVASTVTVGVDGGGLDPKK